MAAAGCCGAKNPVMSGDLQAHQTRFPQLLDGLDMQTSASEVGASPSRVASVVASRNGRAPRTTACVNNDVTWCAVPSGVMRALCPTVDTCTTDRPNSMARSLLIASCCGDSAVYPKVALFVWMTTRFAPARTTSRMTSS